VGLVPGDRWSVEDLLEGLLVRSGNEAAEALALATSEDRSAFIDAMRSDARAIGLGDVTITSPSGLDDGNLLSALELVVLARVALAHPVLAPIVARSSVVLPGVGEVENRNLLVGSYPGATGVKTGFTSAAGNVIVASARRGERELVVAILGSGPDPARFRDAARLLDVGFDAFDDVEPSTEVTYASGAGWWSGSPVTSPSFLLPAGRTAEIVVDLPALLGGPVPDARVTVDGQDVVRVALVTQPPPTASAGPRRGASPSARLAEGVADGVYGALRAAIAAGALG
jgi:D-alanyl-D-alanine carboxypeptidase (penicillin-binding protein 5/6)